MYLTKSTVRWHCVLVEIEKPHSRFFKDASSDFHRDFMSALEQINNWRAWFSSVDNKKSFLGNSIGFLRSPAMSPTVDIKYVLVHGRRKEIENNSIRLGKVMAQERDDFRIMSYDGLAENLSSRWEAYIAAKKNDHVQILSSKFVGEGIFSWLEPETIRINEELRADTETYRRKINSMKFVDNQPIRCIDHYLDVTS